MLYGFNLYCYKSFFEAYFGVKVFSTWPLMLLFCGHFIHDKIWIWNLFNDFASYTISIMNWLLLHVGNFVFLFLFVKSWIQMPGIVLVEFGFYPTLSESSDPMKKVPCIAIILHYLVKQLPAEFISMNALEFIELFNQNKDMSLDQVCAEWHLLEHKMCCPLELSMIAVRYSFICIPHCHHAAFELQVAWA